MNPFRNSTFLRSVLLIDAVTCAASGLILLVASQAVSRILGLPVALVVFSGVILLPFAAFLAYLATREHLSRRAVWAVIILNVLWTIDSILILFAGWITPTELGSALVAAQAIGVAVLAGLEYMGMRKSVMATA
jgi:hypothetical protein